MDLAALLTLMSVPHIGIIRARRLVDHFGSPEEVLCAPPEQIAALPDMGHKTAQSIPLADYDAASQQLKKMNEAGARCVTLWDEDYPPRL